MERLGGEIDTCVYYVLFYLATSAMFYVMVGGLHDEEHQGPTRSGYTLLLALVWPLILPVQLIAWGTQMIGKSGSIFIGRIIRYLTKEK
jgi:hypothetical protein